MLLAVYWSSLSWSKQFAREIEKLLYRSFDSAQNFTMSGRCCMTLLAAHDLSVHRQVEVLRGLPRQRWSPFRGHPLISP
jgi:hypothetical protein